MILPLFFSLSVCASLFLPMLRRDRNRLSKLKNKDGVWVEGQKENLVAIEDYLKDIYFDSIPNIEYECLITPSVSQAMNDALIAPVLEGDVKQAVFALCALKSPGPNELNGEFLAKVYGLLVMGKTLILQETIG